MSELKPCPSPVENAITVLKNEKQCVLRQIQIGGCDRNCAKCDLVMKDSEILAGYDTAVAVLRRAQPDHSGDATEMPANDSLTLEQLREMDGEPVWIVPHRGIAKWYLVDAANECCSACDMDVVDFELYGPENTSYGWLAYRHKPGGEQE